MDDDGNRLQVRISSELGCRNLRSELIKVGRNKQDNKKLIGTTLEGVVFVLFRLANLKQFRIKTFHLWTRESMI